MKSEHFRPHTKGWQISPPKILMTNRIMQLITSKVRCSRTGKSHDFYRLDFPSWVNVIAATDNGELILIRQFRFGTSRVELEIPGGAVNEGEDPAAAGLRELLEETGYSGDNCRIIGKVCPNPAIQNNFCYTVLVENARRIADPKQDDMEDIEVLTLAQEEVASLVTNGTINHGLVLNGLMFFAMEMGKNISYNQSP